MRRLYNVYVYHHNYRKIAVANIQCRLRFPPYAVISNLTMHLASGTMHLASGFMFSLLGFHVFPVLLTPFAMQPA